MSMKPTIEKPFSIRSLLFVCLLTHSCVTVPVQEEMTTRYEGYKAPVDFTVSFPLGFSKSLSEYRGRPLLLFFFSTYDDNSLLTFKSVEAFAEQHPDAQILAIAIQPNANNLLQAWATAMQPSFPVGYDAEDVVIQGYTSLGKIDVVPTLIWLDASGRPTVKHQGYASPSDIGSIK